ncbi:MAG: flavodoxin family protein [Candidatus Omnitrophica bacterium]|jgi:multimeric flavodoxin WrbA|nr:flavodoxin family protein [Candidatus Omnitrophota bacterium]
MKILGINGSPRIGGNTDILLDKVLEGAKISGAETEKIILNKLKFVGCQECREMPDDRPCIIQDDMQSIYPKIKNAERIIVASPIFFGSITAQTKAMIDRFQCVWRAKYVLKKDMFSEKKIGAFISVEGSNIEYFFTNARQIIKNFFNVVNIEYKYELFCPQTDKKNSILDKPDCLEKAFELGKKLATF